MKRTDPQFKLRLPPALKEALERAAEAGERTLTAEIVERLERSLEREEGALAATLARMESLVTQRERELRDAARMLAPVVLKAAESLPDGAKMPGDPGEHTVGFWRAVFGGVDGLPPVATEADYLSHAITWSRLMLATKPPSEG